MNVRRRRDFLADVGRGMLVASIGSAATLELGLVKSFAANIDDAVGRVDTVVEEHAYLVFVGTQEHVRALCRELSAHEDVLQVIEAGILSECVDGGQTTGVRLGIRDGDQNERRKEDSGK